MNLPLAKGRYRKRHLAAAGTALAVLSLLSTGQKPRAGEPPAANTPRAGVPLGLPAVPHPARNPSSPAKIALGKKLFFDPLLSRDATMACATCHDPAQAYTTRKPPVRSPPVIDQRLRRNVPSLLNVAYAAPLHHDGGEPTLEVQIFAPLFNAAEMANTGFDDLVARIAAKPEYRDAFASVFGGPPTIETIGYAIAGFERSLLAGNAPFDRWHYGNEDGAVSPEAKAGFALFTGKAGCATCHNIGEHAAIFTDNAFHDTGIGARSEAARAAANPALPSDLGREEITHNRADRYRYRTPGLRDVALTAPYMHDGSIETLEDVIAYYDAGGSREPAQDDRITPLELSPAEKRQLLAFLESLTSETIPAMPPKPSAP